MENKCHSPGACPARGLFRHARTNAITSCDRVTRSTYLQTQSAQNFPFTHPDVPAARSRRKRKGNAMPISDWQSPAAYEHAQDIAAAGMAWEYLRRDDEYRRAFQKMKTLPVPKPGGSKVFSKRWGLRFPCRSVAACRPHACLLDTGTLA
ncbi:transcriptional regulator domain-containing protein [Gluconobacter sp. Dm-62]|uniref:transcriptional regulator domain-containing protein n=1 Tax=Gluconobacter sp. Dm-62 TaxID=2799804 RepID=UPI0038D1E5BF